jgi:voltage-gated potassium channel
MSNRVTTQDGAPEQPADERATPPADGDRQGLSRFRRPGALEHFEQKTAWPMMGVVLASLVLLIVPIFVSLSVLQRDALASLEWILWLVFAAEFGTRWYIAMDRSGFVRHNLIDLAVVVLPMIPALRALRLFRLVRVAVVGARVIDQSDSIIKRSNTKYAMMVAVLIVLLAAVMVWHVEHDNPQSSIHSITDALWWAVTTVTTVGYGDKYPQSPEGKAVAIGLMILGIAIFGLVSATLASYFIESDTKDEYEDVRDQLARVETKLDALIAEMELGRRDGQP